MAQKGPTAVEKEAAELKAPGKVTPSASREDSEVREPLVFWKPLAILAFTFVVECIVKWISYTWPTRFLFFRVPGFDDDDLLALGWTYSENYGSAFGIFSNQELWVRVTVHIICSAIVVGVAILTVVMRCSWQFKVGLYCYFFGGLGNLVDRWFVGFVVDYFYVRSYFTPRDLAFNISDLVINVGFVFLVAACLSSTPFDEDDDASMAPTSVDPSVEPSVEASKE